MVPPRTTLRGSGAHVCARVYARAGVPSSAPVSLSRRCFSVSPLLFLTWKSVWQADVAMTTPRAGLLLPLTGAAERTALSVLAQTRRPPARSRLWEAAPVSTRVWPEHGRPARLNRRSPKSEATWSSAMEVKPNRVELFPSSQNLGFISAPTWKIRRGDVTCFGVLPDRQETEASQAASQTGG